MSEILYEFVCKFPEGHVYEIIENGKKKTYYTNWDWGEKGLSSNPSISLKLLEKFPDKPWNWGEKGLSSNPSITLEMLERFEDKPWNWGAYCGENYWVGQALSNNRCITLEILERFENKPWVWGGKGLSRNSAITVEILERFKDKEWDWEELTRNMSLTPEIIKKHHDKPWDWEYLSDTDLISDEIVEMLPDKNWNWGNHSKNLFGNYYGLSSNKNITSDLIDKLPDKIDKWCWVFMAESKKFKPETIKKYEKKLYINNGLEYLSNNSYLTSDIMKLYPPEKWWNEGKTKLLAKYLHWSENIRYINFDVFSYIEDKIKSDMDLYYVIQSKYLTIDWIFTYPEKRWYNIVTLFHNNNFIDSIVLKNDKDITVKFLKLYKTQCKKIYNEKIDLDTILCYFIEFSKYLYQREYFMSFLKDKDRLKIINYQKVSRDKKITLEYLCSYRNNEWVCNRKWNWGVDGISSHAHLDIEWIKKFPKKDWCWSDKYYHNYPTKQKHSRYIFGGISNNTNVRPSWVEYFPNKPWDFGKDGLSANTFDYNTRHFNHNIDKYNTRYEDKYTNK